MHRTIIKIKYFCPPKKPQFNFHTSSKTLNPQINSPELFPRTLISSPNKIHKLISSQSDPLLAKEIFDLSSKYPNFQHSYPTFHTLIIKLGNSRHFSFMEDLLAQLRKNRFPVPPELFSSLISIYGDAHLPQKVVNLFYSIIHYNSKPNVDQLNCVLGILLAHRGFIRPAFGVFRDARKYGVSPNLESYKLLIKAFCLNDDLSIAYKLFGEMPKRDIVPDVETYRILMQGLCRKSQVSTAVNLLYDMLNKGFVADELTYTTLLNSLCRKMMLREAYKLLCRMKIKGCNPNIIHYNTVVVAMCREGRAFDAIKVLDDMYLNKCSPDLETYRSLVGGLIDQGMYDDARKYLNEMMSKGLSPHFSIGYRLVRCLCNVGKVDDGCGVLEELLRYGQVPYVGLWEEVVPKIFVGEKIDGLGWRVDEVMKPRIVEAGVSLEENCIKKTEGKSRKLYGLGCEVDEAMKVKKLPHMSTVEAGVALEEYLKKKTQAKASKIDGLGCQIDEADVALEEDLTKKAQAKSRKIDGLGCEVDEVKKVEISPCIDEVMKVVITPPTRIVDAGVALEEYLSKKALAKSREKGGLGDEVDEAMMPHTSTEADEVMKLEIMPPTRIVDAGVALEEYLSKKTQAKSRKIDGLGCEVDEVMKVKVMSHTRTEVDEVMKDEITPPTRTVESGVALEEYVTKKTEEVDKELNGREDDNIETIRKRFKVYMESSLPVIEYYDAKGKVRKIDASKPAEDVFEDVKVGIRSHDSHHSQGFFLGSPALPRCQTG